jgi:hypothetical protein
MADVYKIGANGIEYDIKDEEARNSLQEVRAEIDEARAEIDNLTISDAESKNLIHEIQGQISELHVVPNTSIGTFSGESQTAKIQRAISNGILPIGTPFIGSFISGSIYFVCGHLYYSGNGLYGFVMAGNYIGLRVWNINNGVYNEKILA